MQQTAWQIVFIQILKKYKAFLYSPGIDSINMK